MALREKIHFRLIQMPCCHHLLCWVNPRLPNYCPECGAFVYAKLKTQGDLIQVSDMDALIKYHT